MIDKKFILGAALGAGALLLVPGVAKSLSRAARPLIKAAAKTGTVAYKEFRQAGAEAYEHVEDIVAEIQHEISDDVEQADAKAFAEDVTRAFTSPGPANGVRSGS